MKRPFFLIAYSLLLAAFTSGCSFAWKSVRERQMETELEQVKGRLQQAQDSEDKLQAELSRVQDERSREVRLLVEEKAQATRRVAEEKEEEASELVEAQRRLAESLKQELGDARAKLEMTQRGLVLTLLDEIFFDSGKAVIKEEGRAALEKVASVLKESVPGSPVAVEGHTDNEPIRYSGWKSNWELSSARALAVVHHFIEEEKVPPGRLRAVGFGEFHPVAGNDLPEGRRQNRRVEIVILPATLTKEKTS
ncbi:MAG: flagellar motor protein MotB [Candidatus Omnitrophica bacterium]|nr:flagellar motor protein MotB [Candidatus Omnitrophota bacterium]